MRIAVYGMGKLGFPLATLLARKHFVTGVDPFVASWITAQHQFDEPGVFWPPKTNNLSLAMQPVASDMSFVIVPTPSARNGEFDPIHVQQALVDIKRANPFAKTHLVVLVSTVSPGTCDGLATQFENSAFRLVYNPTFIALGRVLKDLTDPDMILIGARDQADGQFVADLWRDLIGLGHYERVASFIEIELLKLSINCALGVKISLANSLGQLFEAYGVSKGQVSWVGKDRRIGESYLMPGSPITGPCLPRDNAALQAAARRVNLKMRLSKAADRVNNDLLFDLLRRVLKHQNEHIGIIGLGYKTDSMIQENSVGTWLAEQLRNYAVEFSVYEPLAGRRYLDPFLANVDVIVVTLPEYRPLVEHSKKEIIELWPS